MQKELDDDHCRIAVIGNVDAGKSSLVGVLTKGEADDGRGSARIRVFNYPHEDQTGRTSSIAHEIMGFDKNGVQYVPSRFNQNKNKYWNEVVENSKKIVTIVDLCGHEKYLKTTMFGLTGLVPDYAMIVIGLNMGIQKMTKEHLGITIALKIPFFVVLTKVDLCPENIYKQTLDTLKKLIRGAQVNKIPIEVQEGHGLEETAVLAEQLHSVQRICPIFIVSSVTKQGMKEMVHFIGRLKNRDDQIRVFKSENDPFEFDIHEHFMVDGVGIVVSGVVKGGRAVLNQVVHLGPDKNRQFKSVVIRSIHVNRASVKEVGVGKFATFGIKPHRAGEKILRTDFRKGMVMLAVDSDPQCVYEFEANINVLHHASTIQLNYQAVMHCGVIRQAAQIKKIFFRDKLMNGDKGFVRFRFLYAPEYLQPGKIVLFREGRTKILGEITRVLTEEEVAAEQMAPKQSIVNQDTPQGALVQQQQHPQQAAIAVQITSPITKEQAEIYDTEQKAAVSTQKGAAKGWQTQQEVVREEEEEEKKE